MVKENRKEKVNSYLVIAYNDNGKESIVECSSFKVATEMYHFMKINYYSVRLAKVLVDYGENII